VGAEPVITTATDVNRLPAIDVLAVQKHLSIENPGAIKHVSMALLEKRPVGLHDPFALLSGCLPGAVAIDAAEDTAVALAELQPAVFVDDRVMELPEQTLVLRPPSLVLGVGCNRNTVTDEIVGFILEVLRREGLSRSSLYCLASVDLKQDEEGLLDAARRLDLKIRFFSREQLQAVRNIQTPSAMVEKHIGVKSVCEAAALKAAPRGALVVPKQKTSNVTVAVVRKSSTS
jgi:cobalt-precorrin 5A hydrolase